METITRLISITLVHDTGAWENSHGENHKNLTVLLKLVEIDERVQKYNLFLVKALSWLYNTRISYNRCNNR